MMCNEQLIKLKMPMSSFQQTDIGEMGMQWVVQWACSGHAVGGASDGAVPCAKPAVLGQPSRPQQWNITYVT